MFSYFDNSVCYAFCVFVFVVFLRFSSLCVLWFCDTMFFLCICDSVNVCLCCACVFVCMMRLTIFTNLRPNDFCCKVQMCRFPVFPFARFSRFPVFSVSPFSRSSVFPCFPFSRFPVSPFSCFSVSPFFLFRFSVFPFRIYRKRKNGKTEKRRGGERFSVFPRRPAPWAPASVRKYVRT